VRGHDLGSGVVICSCSIDMFVCQCFLASSQNFGCVFMNNFVLLDNSVIHSVNC
jgi:hypothetical protein